MINPQQSLPLSRIPVPDRFLKFLDAWDRYGDSTKLSGMSQAIYYGIIAASIDTRKAQQKAFLISKECRYTRDQIEKQLHQFLTQLSYAVRAHPDHGPESPFYRVLGYVPPSERRRGSSRAAKPQPLAAPGDPASTTADGSNPESPAPPVRTRPSKTPILPRAERALAYWAEYGYIEFSGMKQQDLKRIIDRLKDLIDRLVASKVQESALIALRTAADAKSLEATQRALAAILADPKHGPDGIFYRALGYVPISERRGTTRNVSASPDWRDPSDPSNQPPNQG